MITQLSAQELKGMIDEGRSFELFDVRTTDERAIAQIDGSHLLDQQGYEYLLRACQTLTACTD